MRVLNSADVEVSVDSSYLSLLENSSPVKAEFVAVSAPEIDFKEIKIPVERKVITQKFIAIKKPAAVKSPELNIIEVAKSELPFGEPVKLNPIQFDGKLLSNLVALYDALPVEEKVLVAEEKIELKVDEVKTVQSSEKSADVEPEFFEYEARPKTEATSAEVAAAAVPVKDTTIENVQITVQDIQTAAVPAKSETKVAQDVNLIAFDYSGLKQDLRDNKVPTVSAVTTHPRRVGKPSVNPVRAPDVQEEEREEKSLAPKFQSQMTIQGVATDLKTSGPLLGFEVRFQDNLEVMEDYGDGEITTTVNMARNKMTRSTVLLKRGFAPTNTDVIFEDGAGSVSIPVLSQELFDDLMLAHENDGAIGAVLVELDDSTEIAKLDVPFGKVITLDGDMRETSSEDFRYQLFVGVKAGNAILSYTHGNEVTHKIIHIHEREVSYEANYFEKTNIDQVSLYQEDLLSREKSPLVTASENVKVFAKNIQGEKLNQNTYRIEFGKSLLGARNYLELTHEAEPLFVGTKDETKISVPSESFIRHVLGSLPESKLGNRCAIQVNMKKKVSDVAVAAESVGESLMVNTQYLDADGKFYESVSEKTRKIVVFGENQGADSQDMNGKVNLKITYLDGSVDFLGTFCSPNTYLVEQL